MTASAPVTVSGPVTPNVAETDVEVVGDEIASRESVGAAQCVALSKPVQSIVSPFAAIERRPRVAPAGQSTVTVSVAASAPPSAMCTDAGPVTPAPCAVKRAV